MGGRGRRVANVNYEAAVKIALSLPEAELNSSARGISVKVKGRMLFCEATHRSAETGSIVLRIAPEERDRWIAAHPDVCYVTEHYTGYPSMLVRLGPVERATLLELFNASWYFVNAGASR